MATINQRALSLLEALLNAPPTLEQRQEVLAAFGSAEGFVMELYNYAKTRVKASRRRANQAAVDQAVDSEYGQAS